MTDTTALPTPEEMIDSLTGYEEVAIAKAFDGVDFFDLQGLKTVRALVFVQRLREGLNHKAALDSMMKMTVAQCNDSFTVDDETDPEDPVTTGGKDDSPLE